jgi:DNA-binding LacI/PurR family transcriptional regulator/DNA-binding transcriptional regulator YhcF (GntR family)
MSSSDRATPKQTYVENAVRKKIVAGEWPPGSRLRTRAQLHKEFGVSIVTLQHAFDQLAEEGFVEARGRSGTFVADNPPHVSQFALAIPFDPEADGDRWSNFWDALINEARALEEDYPYAILPYYGVGKHPEAKDYRMLVEEVEAHRIAGIIFATAPHLVTGTPLTDEPGIPHAAIMSAPSWAAVAAVDPDVGSFYRSALDHLAAAGRRRIAVVAPNRLPVEEDLLRDWLAERGLKTRRHWLQMPSPWLEEGARRCAHLLMSNRADRPDGLIIADDNLVPAVTRGVSDAGVRVPEEVEVVAHTNFPWSTEAAVPVSRVGFDVRRVLKERVERILEQRRGEMPPALTTIEPVCEKEFRGQACEMEANAAIV